MDEACLEKLAGILIGVSVAGAAAAGAGLLPGLTEVGTGAAGLWLRLTGQRRRDADAVLAKLTQTIGQDWQAWGQTASFADDRLRASVVASFETVIPRCTIPAASVVAARLDADAVADLVLAQAEVALPGVYADRNPRNVEAHHARMFLLNVTRRAYAALLAEPGYIDTIAPDLWRGVLDGIGRIEDTTGRIDATTQETAADMRDLKAMVAALTQATAARASGITDDALIDLARRIAADVDDPAAAFRELENAVEVAIREQAEGRQGSNLGDFVDEVLRRVTALSAKGQFDRAAREIDSALAQEHAESTARRIRLRQALAEIQMSITETKQMLVVIRSSLEDYLDPMTATLRSLTKEQAESTARRIRLLDAGLAQDILRRDPESAARRLIQKADLNAGGAATVSTLRDLWFEWYERGRDQGLNFDLAIAIELSTNTLPRANGSDDRGAILNDLGTALRTLGEREAGTARLEEAVAAYRAALTEYRQDRVPLDWARTLGNEGVALLTLADRTGDLGRARQALEQLTLAEATLRSGGHIPWAETFVGQIPAAEGLVDRLSAGPP